MLIEVLEPGYPAVGETVPEREARERKVGLSLAARIARAAADLEALDGYVRTALVTGRAGAAIAMGCFAGAMGAVGDPLPRRGGLLWFAGACAALAEEGCRRSAGSLALPDDGASSVHAVAELDAYGHVRG